MDRRDFDAGAAQKEAKPVSDLGRYVTEGGKQYRMPYRMVRKATFSNIKKSELVDIPHSTRLQYRLMLLGAVIKAVVDFADEKITIIYNPDGADNASDKTTLGELVAALSKEGVRANPGNTADADYDYYSELYSNSHNPQSIRESPPYGYTNEEWAKMKAKWEKKAVEDEAKKREKFKRWQESYLKSNPGLVQKTA